eukprot:Awhi_evm1s172
MMSLSSIVSLAVAFVAVQGASVELESKSLDGILLATNPSAYCSTCMSFSKVVFAGLKETVVETPEHCEEVVDDKIKEFVCPKIKYVISDEHCISAGDFLSKQMCDMADESDAATLSE